MYLADSTNSHAYDTVLCPSVCLSVSLSVLYDRWRHVTL